MLCLDFKRHSRNCLFTKRNVFQNLSKCLITYLLLFLFYNLFPGVNLFLFLSLLRVTITFKNNWNIHPGMILRLFKNSFKHNQSHLLVKITKKDRQPMTKEQKKRQPITRGPFFETDVLFHVNFLYLIFETVLQKDISGSPI